MVNCNKCNKQITDPNDVNVLAFFGIKPTTMCNSCYASRERGITRHLFYYPKWFPLNSTPFIIILILATIIFSIIIVAIFLGAGTATVNGEPTEMSIGVKILLSMGFIIILGWQWALWLIAKNKVNAIQSSRGSPNYPGQYQKR